MNPGSILNQYEIAQKSLYIAEVMN